MMEFRLSASMISCLICLRQINIDFHIMERAGYGHIKSAARHNGRDEVDA